MEKSEKKVSVIIPVYNVERYLRECLDSIRNQTLKEIEIICVDDCSPDGSAHIMREYAERDPRIKNIHLPVNGGLAHARNTAMKQINGKYVTFIDSDDMLKEDALQKLYNIAEANELDQLLFLPETLFECSLPSYKKYYKDFPKELTERCYTGKFLFKRLFENGTFYPSVCLKFFKRDLLLKNNISFINGYIHEDNYFSCKTMISSSKTAAINERLYIRRVRSDSIMTSSNIESNINHICGYAAQIGMLQHEIKQGVYSDTDKELIHDFCIRLTKAIAAYCSKLKKKHIEDLLQRLSECPGDENWRMLFGMICTFDNDGKQLKKKISMLQHSLSYRLGRALTWLPRKLKKGIRCLKEHGVVYTLKRIKQKISK